MIKIKRITIWHGKVAKKQVPRKSQFSQIFPSTRSTIHSRNLSDEKKERKKKKNKNFRNIAASPRPITVRFLSSRFSCVKWLPSKFYRRESSEEDERGMCRSLFQLSPLTIFADLCKHLSLSLTRFIIGNFNRRSIISRSIQSFIVLLFRNLLALAEI